MSLSFEQALAFHCAPALTGIKPADLFSWEITPEHLAPLLADYAAVLGRRGISLRLLCARGRRCLLLVYRPDRLARQLEQPAVQYLLRRDGYPVGQGAEVLLDHLARRLAGDDCPHEVGLFLGYPPGDVEGFRLNHGRNFKLCGLWKVYCDMEQAAARFQRYTRCRNTLLRKVSQGHSLAQLFPAA